MEDPPSAEGSVEARPPSPRLRRLVSLIQASVDAVGEDALRHCEERLPGLHDSPEPDRDLRLAAVRYLLELWLEVVLTNSPVTKDQERPLREYLTGAAARGVPVGAQLQVARISIAHTLGVSWARHGRESSDELHLLAARTAGFHGWLERLIDHSYRVRPALTASREDESSRLRTLLVGGSLPAGDDSASWVVPGLATPAPYVVVVLVSGTDSREQASLPSPAGTVSRTVIDGAEVLVLPAEPDGDATARRIVERTRRAAGSARAAAATAQTTSDLRAAYTAARERMRGVAGQPGGDPVIDEAIPESLLLSDSSASLRLLACLDRLNDHPELIRTLVAFFDSDLDRTRTSERLFLHRRTITQRLQRISALTGYDPRTARGIQVLGLALTARRLSRRAATEPTLIGEADAAVLAPRRPLDRSDDSGGTRRLTLVST